MQILLQDDQGRIKAITADWLKSENLLSPGGNLAKHAKTYTASVWAFRCIKIRAATIAGIPWDLMVRDKSVSDTHELRKLLRDVNRDYNWEDLIRATESDKLIFGKAYWLKVRPENSARIRELQRINPITMKIVATKEGIQGWEQHIDGVKVAEFAREDVVYFREYDPTDDVGGLSPLEVALMAVNAGQEASGYLAAFFKNFAIPPLLLSSDHDLSEKTIEKTKRWWDKLFKGASKQHKVGIVGGGLKPVPLGYPTGDLAMDTVMDSVRKDICASFGVPPAIAGAWEAANYAASKEQRQSLYEDTVIPEARYYAGVLNAELTPEYKDRPTFEWLVDELPIMQPDRESEARIHVNLVKSGIESPTAAAEEMDVTAPSPEELERLERQRQSNLAQVPPEKSSSWDNGSLGYRDDLAKWERKAVKRLRKGQSAACEFESDHIPDTQQAAISGALEVSETIEDVRRVFTQALVWRGYP